MENLKVHSQAMAAYRREIKELKKAVSYLIEMQNNLPKRVVSAYQEVLKEDFGNVFVLNAYYERVLRKEYLRLVQEVK